MNILHRYKKGINKKMFNEVDYTVLNYNQLLETNGAKGGSGGGGPSGPSSTSNSSNRGYPSSTEGYDPSTPSDITVNPRYTEQKYFSSIWKEMTTLTKIPQPHVHTLVLPLHVQSHLQSSAPVSLEGS